MIILFYEVNGRKLMRGYSLNLWSNALDRFWALRNEGVEVDVEWRA